MRAQRVREAENRVEMQTGKWTAEGAAKSWIYFQPSTLRRRAYVRCRRYAGISQSAWNHSMNQGVTGVRSEIATDIGAMVNLVKEESDIPCAVCGRIREINEKRDSVKKRKPSVKESFILSQTVFFFWLQKPCSVVNALGWWQLIQFCRMVISLRADYPLHFAQKLFFYFCLRLGIT